MHEIMNFQGVVLSVWVEFDEYEYCSHTSKMNPGLTCSNEIMNFQGLVLSVWVEFDGSSM